MVPLFIVEDRFQIAGRGCILVPGIPDDASLPVIRVKDKIVLVRPDLSQVSTYIAGIEMINYRTEPQRITTPILLPSDLSKEDVPVGTEVLLRQNQ